MWMRWRMPCALHAGADGAGDGAAEGGGAGRWRRRRRCCRRRLHCRRRRWLVRATRSPEPWLPLDRFASSSPAATAGLSLSRSDPTRSLRLLSLLLV